MGRLFQYNRFGRQDNAGKKDMPARCSSKTKELKDASHRSGQYRTLVCPSYSELYPEYRTITAKETKPSTTSTSAKSVETTTTIRKHLHWSSRFLTGCQPTTTTASSSLRFQSQRQTGVGRTKVYDCMKDFLKRKLFQQPTEEGAKLAADAEDDEATSDYDEIDVLDSSYNADEEYDSDSTSSSCTCLVTDHEEEPAEEETTKATNPEQSKAVESPGAHQKPTKSPKKPSLNCWLNATPADSTSASCSSSSDDDHLGDLEDDEASDSDAGISDCCQLLSDKSPKRRAGRQTKRQRAPRARYNRTDDGDDEELLQDAWYQPQLSSKAALERLQHEAPGAFVMRRKAGGFELSLRLAAKVKHFAVLGGGAESFRFKGAKKQFSSLKALVTHHSVMAEQLPVTLTLPRPHEPRPQDARASGRCPDDFDTFESLQILGILQRLQAENLDFS